MILTIEEFANNVVKYPNKYRCSYIFIKGKDKNMVCNTYSGECLLPLEEIRCLTCKSKKSHPYNNQKMKEAIEKAKQIAVEKAAEKAAKDLISISSLDWNDKKLCDIKYIEIGFTLTTDITSINSNDNLYLVNGNENFIADKSILNVDIAVHHLANGNFFLGTITRMSLTNPITYNILRFFEDSKSYNVNQLISGEPIFKDLTKNKLFRIVDPYYLQVNHFYHTAVKKLNQDISTEPNPDLEDCNNPCLFCLSKPRIYAFVPCGHLSACEDCGNVQKLEKLNKTQCPFCRKTISSIMRIYN